MDFHFDDITHDQPLLSSGLQSSRGPQSTLQWSATAMDLLDWNFFVVNISLYHITFIFLNTFIPISQYLQPSVSVSMFPFSVILCSFYYVFGTVVIRMFLNPRWAFSCKSLRTPALKDFSFTVVITFH